LPFTHKGGEEGKSRRRGLLFISLEIEISQNSMLFYALGTTFPITCGRRASSERCIRFKTECYSRNQTG